MGSEDSGGTADDTLPSEPPSPKDPRPYPSKPANGGTNNRRSGEDRDVTPTSENPVWISEKETYLCHHANAYADHHGRGKLYASQTKSQNEDSLKVKCTLKDQRETNTHHRRKTSPYRRNAHQLS